jgi:hypothetical protein
MVRWKRIRKLKVRRIKADKEIEDKTFLVLTSGQQKGTFHPWHDGI